MTTAEQPQVSIRPVHRGVAVRVCAAAECAALVILAILVWALVGLGVDALMANLRPILGYAVLFGGTTGVLAFMSWRMLAGLWRLVAAAHVPRAARESMRLLTFVVVNPAISTLARSAMGDLSAALWSIALTVSAWLVIVVLWSSLDAAMMKIAYAGVPPRARHPAPAESARVEPLLREVVERMHLDWIPWLLIGEDCKAEAGPAFGSVVLLGSKRLTDDSHDELVGTLGHELAHVALDHGPAGASLIAAVIGMIASTWAVLAWASTVLGPTGPIVALVVWFCLVMPLFFLALTRDNYPHEIAADTYAIERGLARELVATLEQMARDEREELGGIWALLLRSHPPTADRRPPTAERLAHARPALAERTID
jgi:Zn-dependent protease with chaperone function